jgi:hypothetical protein
MLDDLDVLFVLSLASALAGIAVLVCLVGALLELVRSRDEVGAAARPDAAHHAGAQDVDLDAGAVVPEAYDEEADEDEAVDLAPLRLPVWVPPALDGGGAAVHGDPVPAEAPVHDHEPVPAASGPVAGTRPAAEPVPADDPAPEPTVEPDADPHPRPALAPVVVLGDERAGRARSRRQRRLRHDHRRDGDVDPARPRLPAGAERALLSIVEVQPDPRNLLALQRDPTAEVRLTDLDRATAAAARDRIELAAARRRHPTAHVRRSA